MKNPYDDKLERIKKLRALWPRIDRSFLAIGYTDSFLIIKIESLEQLTSARRIAKDMYPHWKDKLCQVWNGYSDTMLASWEDKNYPLLEIHLTTSVDSFPKELLSKNCKIEKRTEVGYAVVCQVDSKGQDGKTVFKHP